MKRFNCYLPSLSSSWILVAFLLIGSLVFGGVLSVIGMFADVPLLKSQTLSYILTMVCPLAYAWVMGGRYCSLGCPAVPLNAGRFGRYGAVPFFVATVSGLFSLSVMIEPLAELIPMPDYFRDLFDKVFAESELWDSVIATCILAPLLEELLCRGLMLRGMLRTMSPWKAVLWSAFLFAFMHMNPWQSIPAFIFGCFFGWIYWKSGCLWATILLHCLNNTLSTVLVRTFPDAGAETGFADIMGAAHYYVLYGVCVAVFAVVVLFLLKNYEEKTVSA